MARRRRRLFRRLAARGAAGRLRLAAATAAAALLGRAGVAAGPQPRAEPQAASVPAPAPPTPPPPAAAGGLGGLSGQAGEAASTGNCRNPLFAMHWAGKSDIRVLSARPAVKDDLVLCPMYNGQPSCCNTAFEAEQQRSFDFWVKHWRRKTDHLVKFRLAMLDLQYNSQDYYHKDVRERLLLQKAINSTGLVLENIGACFDTFLEYMAGVICFACSPGWQEKVLLDQADTVVSHICIDDASNQDLWQSCRQLSRRARAMHQRIADAVLTKSVQERFEDMNMLESKVSLAEHMAWKGLEPMRGDNEHVLPAVEAGAAAVDDLDVGWQPEAVLEASKRRLAGTTTCNEQSGGRFYDRDSEPAPDLLDPVFVGRRSGFRTNVFPRTPRALDAGAPRTARRRRDPHRWSEEAGGAQ